MKLTSNCKYSIIIPHYNVPKLLRRCLWSIPKREDTQIIVVDDKSSVETVNQLHGLEVEYPYVEFIYSDVNGGGGKARNIGIRHAKGDYILFADADDFFNYCIRDILNEYIGTSLDIVFFHATHLDTDTYLPSERVSTMMRAIENYKKTENDQYLRFLFDEPWAKLIKKSLILDYDIFFEESPIHNDMRFSYMVGYYAKDIKLDKRSIYCLADRSDSVSKAVSDDKQEIRTRIMSEKNRFLEDHGIKLFDDILLLPFIYYKGKRNNEQLEKCFIIAKDFGFSKKRINNEISKQKWNGRKKKLYSIFSKIWNKGKEIIKK